ncbi:MAG TPA: sulfatase [Thermoanaerobaculia bacterium]|jgi:arylsulfatase A-like enzyme|nr:sulfatase [Thermoanaerobaculia bacterium]
MRRRWTYHPSLLVLAVLLGPLAGCARQATAPNIVLVSIDTVRRDALRAYDPAAQPLPALDALAARSVRFTDAMSPAAWTLPAHASLLTGVYPHRHGAVHRRASLARTVPTLAGLLAGRGYETVAFTDGGYLDASYGFGRGFMRYDDHVSRGVAPLPWLPEGGKPSPAGESDLFARAEAFLSRHAPGRPLFLFVHTYAVHDYYKAHAWAHPPPGAADADHNLACLLGEQRCPSADWQALAGYYRAELRRLDGGIGQLLAAIRADLGDRPTWIVVVSDHGEGLDPASGHTHHGGALDHDLLAVPLLISGPGAVVKAVDTPVSLVDVAPTLVALGGGHGRGFDGSSLVPLLFGGVHGRLQQLALAYRGLHAEEHYYWWRDGRRRASRDVGSHPLAVAVLHGGWWYVHEPHGEAVQAVEPAATSPALPATPPPLLALRRAATPLLRTPAVPTLPHAESKELTATLKSLGYGSGGVP